MSDCPQVDPGARFIHSS